MGLVLEKEWDAEVQRTPASYGRLSLPSRDDEGTSRDLHCEDCIGDVSIA